jgi:hypothetical protein
MHPRVKVILIALVVYSIIGISFGGKIMSIDWHSPGSERGVVILLLWGFVPALSVATHFFSGFEKNFKRWCEETNLQEAGSMMCQFTLDRRLASRNAPVYMETAFTHVERALEEKHTRGEFVRWIFFMFVATLFLGWIMVLGSFSFSKE